MSLRSFLAATLLLTSGLFLQAADNDPVKIPEKKDFQLFLLAGQSNMAGRGPVDAESTKTDPRVLSLNKDGQWILAVDPLHWDKPGAGVGPGKTFGDIVAEKNPAITVGLIPTACGGSPISSWKPGAYFDQTKSHPYDDCIARTKIAMEKGTLKAILWHQGESDSTEKSAPAYEAALRELIERFRKEFGLPDLPVIIGQLGRFPAKSWDKNREMVDQAQRKVAETMPHVYFVTSDELISKGDNLHFDAASQRILAKRYAEAYLKNESH